MPSKAGGRESKVTALGEAKAPWFDDGCLVAVSARDGRAEGPVWVPYAGLDLALVSCSPATAPAQTPPPAQLEFTNASGPGTRLSLGAGAAGTRRTETRGPAPRRGPRVQTARLSEGLAA